MATSDTTRQTLLDCLSERKLSQPEALDRAVLLAQELCRIHAAGRTHGSLSPAVIVLTEDRMELISALPDGEITPYTAPEVLAGSPCDFLSDIFSFGAVVYEMLAGCRAFDGDTPQALAVAIVAAKPRPCAGAAVDRLVQTCLAKDRGARFSRMEKVLMELRLAATAAGCGRLPAQAPWQAAHAQLENDLRAALDSIRSDLKRNEETVAWVVELLEVLQSTSMVAKQG